MKCPYKKELDCPYIDTLTMTKEMDCKDCEHSKSMDDWNDFLIKL